ncbi:hypothetical protein NSA31_18710, partial [Bacillus subtilis]|uniref:hypothetical protein n=1 Tax=Bacillus subtilis TaxID=1423 RepID=UPI00214A0597
PDEYLKKQYKTKKLVEKTSFSLQAEKTNFKGSSSTIKFGTPAILKLITISKPLDKQRGFHH